MATDKVTRYRQLILAWLEEFAKAKPANLREVEQQILADHERGHYALITIGFQKDRHVYLPLFHLDLKPDGKVYLQRNETDRLIADELVEQGIAREDIVLAFHPPELRVHTGFGVG